MLHFYALAWLADDRSVSMMTQQIYTPYGAILTPERLPNHAKH